MNKTVYLVAAASALLSLAGCQLNKQTPDYSKIYANAIVTVKHTPEDVFYLHAPLFLGADQFDQRICLGIRVDPVSIKR